MVFIGSQLNISTITEKLDACLLNASEMLAVSTWSSMSDPFPLYTDFEYDEEYTDDDDDVTDNDEFEMILPNVV